MATAIRDYLKSKGLADDQITYQDGTVYAKGKRFMDAAPSADGRTYADSKALDNSYNNYDTMNQIADLRTRAQTPNPEQTAMQQALKDRINRPVQQFSYDQNSDPAYQAALRQAQANAGTAQNNTLANLRARGQGKSSYSEAVANQIQQKEMSNVANTIQPQLMQQAYQRYMGQNQLENQQLGNMLTYSRDLGNQDQSQIANLAQVLGMQNNYNQQQTTNDRNTALDARTTALDSYNQQRNRIQDAQWGVNTYGYGEAKQDPGVFFDQYQGATPLAVQQIAQQRAMQEAGLTGTYNGQPTMQRETMSFNQGLQDKQFGLSERQANASIANMGADNSRANEANVLARDRFDWEKDPNNPNNIYKQASADKQQPVKLDSKESVSTASNAKQMIQSGTNPTNATAKQYIDTHVKNMVNDSEYKDLIKWVDEKYPK